MSRPTLCFPTALRRLAWFIPAAGWLRKYPIKEFLLADILAGIAVAVTVIPQGMSYAKLAGLPNQYGLYGAFVPCLVGEGGACMLPADQCHWPCSWWRLMVEVTSLRRPTRCWAAQSSWRWGPWL